MAYKKLSDAMSGSTPAAPAKKPAAATTSSGAVKSFSFKDVKSSVSTRDQYARAMNAGNRKEADRLYRQMQDEEAAANVAGKLKK